MSVTALRRYVERYLQNELLAVQNSLRVNELNNLSIYEKATIYKYTNDGYESLNENLRATKGINNNLYGTFLEQTLKKLRNYVGVVYRGVFLYPDEIQRYSSALSDNVLINEYSFLSTSSMVSIANQVPGMNCLFVIFSKTGKEIEKIAKFGLHNPPNEHEVLFPPNIEFKVLGITTEPSYTLITLEEV